MAIKIKKSEFAGAGAAVQFGGVLCFFVGFVFPDVSGMAFFIFAIAAGALLIIGSRMANVLKCSDCLGKVDREAQVCRHCGARLDDLPTAPKGPAKDGTDRAMRDALR